MTYRIMATPFRVKINKFELFQRMYSESWVFDRYQAYQIYTVMI